MAKRARPKPVPPARAYESAPKRLSPRVLAGAALIVVAVCVAYYPSLHGGFILDDKLNLTDNPLIKASNGLYKFWFTTEPIDYWPVFNSSLWIEWRLWGAQAAGYRVTNLLLHITDVLLIWTLLRRLAIPGAFLAAFLFAVHPVNVESVAWITQRKNLLALLFVLLSALGYLKAEKLTSPPRRSPPMTDGWYWLSLAAFALAMLSKASVAVFPVLLLGLILWRRPLDRRDVMRTAPFLAVAAVLILINRWFQTHGIEALEHKAGFAERLAGAGAVIWFYLSKALLPVNLAFVYPRWHIQTDRVLWWLPLLAAMAATGVLWRYRRGWGRPVLFAWGFFCVVLAPVMGFTDISYMEYSLVADHYQHLAMIGIMALVAAGWATWQGRTRGVARWVPNVAAIAVGGAFTALTWQQSSLYVNETTLYRDTLAKNPGSWMVHNNLGAVLFDAGKRQEAVQQYEQALQLNPHYADAHNNLGNALRDSGQLPEAMQQYEQALQPRPDFADAHNNLGNALAGMGRWDEAAAHYEAAVRLRPDWANVEVNLGIALRRIGRPADAMPHYEHALQLQPDLAEAHNNLGVALADLNRPAEAIDHYREALRLKPDYTRARTNLENALRVQGAAVQVGGTGSPASP